MDAQANRLIREKSPYLLQHARNPVDWFPWGEEAFAKARAEDKPVFLSVGYSTCHWCHVMERETFEDPEAARLLNEHMVAVKVDREERPDIDSVYMNACHLLSGAGGWPLTVVLTPDKLPFFAGTYFPKTGGFGRPGMLELVPRLAEVWRTRRGEVEREARGIADHLARTTHPARPGDEAPGPRILERAERDLAESFDAEHGGFGNAPKFPSPHTLLFLLRRHGRTGSARALNMARRTLEAMRMGGLYDHLGGGFHRYSTDERWLLPHFEKMLHDQAMLMMAYTEGWQATGHELFRRTVLETADYVLRDMTLEGGGFCSAEDADSEGEEGRFYVFTLDEVERALGPRAGAFAQAYGITGRGNFRDEASGQNSGANVLHLPASLEDAAARLSMDPARLEEELARGRAALLKARDKRVRPLRDDKVLADWNGLMVAALAKAGRALDRPDLTRAAGRAADFVLGNLRGQDGRLLHRWRGGEGAVHAFLDDYAFMAWGLLELHRAGQDPKRLDQALELVRVQMDLFRDPEGGGFFLTARDAERLPARPLDAYDGALPSGNSAGLSNLARLARLTDDPKLRDAAHDLARAFAPQVQAHPSAFAMFLCGLDLLLEPDGS